MKVSQIFFQTLKEVPKEAQIESHRLLYRAGMIQKLASGIYNYLPLILRSIRKLEDIVREELNKRGCQEVLMPAVQPSDLWEESGRWTYYGPELLRFKDRRGGDFCLGPTHEEVITDMVRKNLRSYKQLPYNLYQFQSKFRDEIRPRFGLMRGREFIMKDGYSFDINEEKAKESYELMFEAYNEIFKRCGLKFRAVDAATGAIGGDMSHEFQVLAESGEDLILNCDRCSYAANLEKATSKLIVSADDSLALELKEVSTPDKKAVEDVAAFLNKKPENFIKSMIYLVDEEPVLVMVPGDREVNESKIQAFFKANSVALATDEVIMKVTGAETGFAGPVKLKEKIKIVADRLFEGKKNLVSGANKTDYHLENVNFIRDFTPDETGDFVVTRKGEKCPDCGGTLQECRGIEVGQVFYLGTKYSESMNCNFVDESGKSQTAVMGCYGLGVGRTVQAAIEQNHDEYGIKWPMALAPYEAIVLPLQINMPEVVKVATDTYKKLLAAGVEVVIDDRDERAGFKFNDADLIGYPLQIIFGGKSVEAGVAEVKIRKTGEKIKVNIEEVIEFIVNYKNKELGKDG
ncbi:MAG: proline--tRNA ligase [bacterium]